MFSNVGFFWGGGIFIFIFIFEKKIKEFANRKFFCQNSFGKMAKFTTKIEIKIIDQGTN
jgi:hypothetical protein